APVSLPGLQQIPKEKVTQDQAICTQHIFVSGDTSVHNRAPLVETPSPFRIVFNEQNGNRDDYISTPFQQCFNRLVRIRLRKDDQRHDRMTENFDPPLESHQGKIRPCYGDETVEQENDKPAIILNNL